MSGKSILLAIGGFACVAAVVLLLRGGSQDELDIRTQEAKVGRGAPSEEEESGSTSRWSARPNVFGEASRRNPDDPTADDEEGDPYEPDRPPGRAVNEGGRDVGGARGDSRTANLRTRLQDPSRPFPVEGADGSAGGQRPQARSFWDDDVDTADVVEVDQPDLDDEDRPILSLFDEKDSADSGEASIDKGVVHDDEGGRFSLDSEFAVPVAGRLKGEAGSISFWVRPEGETADLDNASLVQLRSHYQFADRLQIWKDGASVRLVFANSDGVETGAVYKGESWADGEWRLVTATWGEGETALYVNGVLAGKAPYEGGFQIRPDTLLHVGSNYSEDPRSLTGTVSQFRLYDRPLAADEVEGLSLQYPE